MTTTLHYHRRAGLSSEQALKEFTRPDDARIPLLVSTPRECRFLLWSHDAAHDERGQARTPWAEAWELRAFTPDRELRWRREGDGATRAVILGESEAKELTDWDHTADPHEVLGTHDFDYLLWGTLTAAKAPLAQGWVQLWEHQVGPLFVPAEATFAQGRVALEVREYFAELDNDGNTACIEERLLGLTPRKGK